MGERLSPELQEYFSVKHPKKVPTTRVLPIDPDNIDYFTKLKKLDISPETRILDIDNQYLQTLNLNTDELGYIRRILMSYGKVLVDRNLDIFYKVRVSDIRAMTDDQLKLIPVSSSKRGINLLRILFGSNEDDKPQIF